MAQGIVSIARMKYAEQYKQLTAARYALGSAITGVAVGDRLQWTDIGVIRTGVVRKVEVNSDKAALPKDCLLTLALIPTGRIWTIPGYTDFQILTTASESPDA